MELKEARLAKGITQKQLAEMIGKERSLIAKIENMNSLPSVETAKAIGKALGVEWTIFFEKTGENNSH